MRRPHSGMYQDQGITGIVEFYDFSMTIRSNRPQSLKPHNHKACMHACMHACTVKGKGLLWPSLVISVALNIVANHWVGNGKKRTCT